jgi:caffeoyl-CoA O-methyltransferase
MTNRQLAIDDDLYAYVVAHGATPDPVMRDLIDETHTHLTDQAEMQIGPDQAAFLTFLTKLLDAKAAVEVGTFTGMSALAIARGLADGGQLTCFDISEEYTSVARRYWARAGVADRIDLRIGPAAERITELPAEPHIDIAFVDADKTGYPTYWAELVPRMRPGGVIAIDNVLRGGRVVAPSTESDKVVVAFNEQVRDDDRVDAIMLPLADGLTLARRR